MFHISFCIGVNTLKDECREFLRDYGKDGTDHNARARFPCFFSLNDPSVVVSRFNLATTYFQLYIGSIVPTVLFFVSCTCLVLCQRTVEVGDDARMRFKGCGTGEAYFTHFCLLKFNETLKTR